MKETAHTTRRSQREQRIREANEEAIASYLESGAKPQAKAFGIELEHTIVHNDGSAVPYTGKHGIEWILGQLASDYPETTRDEEGDLLGVARSSEAVTLEPAAQIELSAGPFTSLAEAQATFEAFEQRLAAIVEAQGMRITTFGYHPTAHAKELSLIPKKRYKFMNLYFEEIGPWGPRMMRGSASTQVSIDYTSEADCARKMRTALRIAPLLALITDNAPFFEGKHRPHQLMRTEIWEGCDPDRCGLIPDAIDTPLTWRRYARFALDLPAILMPCTRGRWCYTERSFGEIYADRPMERADVEHALSMIFTDARLKTYLELRPADAMPVPYAIAYAALVRGLFLKDASLDALDEAFEGVSAAEVGTAKQTLMAEGYQAHTYGRKAADLAELLIELAYGGLSEADGPFLAPLADLVSRKTTLACEALKTTGRT